MYNYYLSIKVPPKKKKKSPTRGSALLEGKGESRESRPWAWPPASTAHMCPGLGLGRGVPWWPMLALRNLARASLHLLPKTLRWRGFLSSTTDIQCFC